ncbi:hypothetical protein ACX0G9_12195 [Flavitalea flava]
MPQLQNVALIIAHPGHELRVFHFVELYKPRVYILTDGSGSSGTSRLDNTIGILKDCGASISPVMGYFTDKEIYRIILERDYSSLTALAQDILLDFHEHNIRVVAGDAIEGFNPAHDLCRYLINLIVVAEEAKSGKEMQNFDFLLEGLMNEEDASLIVRLDEAGFERKLKAAEGYTELAQELQSVIRKFGKSPFMVECLRRVVNPNKYIAWEGEVPYYEEYALEKVKNGVYKKIISFQEHVLPLIRHLSTHLVTGTPIHEYTDNQY